MIAATEVVERTASYTFKCAIVTATLQERKEQFQVKELECSELQSKLAVEKNLCTQKELECKDLRVNISNAHKDLNMISSRIVSPPALVIACASGSDMGLRSKTPQ
ncbi:hypothetical protein AXG93_3515s1020 [Marchantia polymorpha subsp. ruderalis]|uniref:Uncharacterized protein n=1 Tax=Marchantia polymorpha subsp. ruderalis TaxID=1480154 RepID=A0A176WH89_MARPO|nr:hypothetical protein AXG93_3515s1020 [Marchantia polymorpha subsp. ruderalis]